MMAWLFDLMSFWATGLGLLATLGVVTLIILLWDWRAALIGLVVVQMSLATLSVQIFALPTTWATAFLTTTALSALILAVSMVQVGPMRSLDQAGNWLMRLFAVGILLTAWRLMSIEVALPQMTPNQVQFFTLMALSALMMLSLGDNPLFVGVALLLWMMTAQVLIAVLLPQPTILVMLGALQLLLALTCSYLILADRVPRRATRVVTTDITFPDAVTPVLLLDTDDSIDAPLPLRPRALLAAPPAQPDDQPSPGQRP